MALSRVQKIIVVCASILVLCGMVFVQIILTLRAEQRNEARDELTARLRALQQDAADALQQH